MICLTKLAKEIEIDAAAIAQADVVLVRLPSGKLVTKAEYLATREGPTSRGIVYGAVRAAPPPAPRGGEVDGVALSNSDAFIAVAEKLSRERGINILNAARELLGTWTPGAASSAQPSSPPPAPAPSPTRFTRDAMTAREHEAFRLSPALDLEAERLAAKEKIPVLAAARRIVYERALDARIEAVKLAAAKGGSR